MIINSNSYHVSIGYNASGDPRENSVKYRSFIDGTISPLPYGARRERIAEFTIVNLTKAQYISLVNYFTSQAGNKIQMTPENSGESVFPEWQYGDITDYYVYVLEAKELQEEDHLNDFIQTDRLSLEIGTQLIPLVESNRTKGLKDRIASLRRDVTRKHGLWVPIIRIRSSIHGSLQREGFF